MGISVWQILIVVVLIVLLFGRGKISELMGDFAKGIRSFKKGLSEDDDEVTGSGDPKVLPKDQKDDTTISRDKSDTKAN